MSNTNSGMTEVDHIWEALILRYGSNLVAATVTLLLKDGDKAVRLVTISIPQTGSDLPTTGWRKRQIALDIKAENARELGLDYEPSKTIEMAREAGMVYREFEDEFANANTDGVDLKTIEAFAALVRADEREACAKVCDVIYCDYCAGAIRAGRRAERHGPCVRHCESTAYEIVIRGLKGDIERLKVAQPEQEPVAFTPPKKWRDSEIADGYRGIRWVTVDGVYGTPTQEDVVKYLGYTTPPQRTWVGLTDEDKHLIELSAGITEDDDGYIVSQVFKLTEAKLKEKNT